MRGCVGAARCAVAFRRMTPILSRQSSAADTAGHYQMKFALLLALVAFSFAHDPARAAGPASPWGIASSASGAKNLGEWLPRVHDVGVGTVRLFPEWRTVEPRKGQWNWDKADALVRAASDNRVELTAPLMGSVPWSNEKMHAFPMSNLAAWSEFVAQSVTRYKGRIHRWEVWNEGNGGFNDGRHTTTDYARLAAATYSAAKRADPNAQFALSVASFDPAYLHQALLAQQAAGTPAQFDFLCIHPYELADGLSSPNGEIPYLWMTRLLRELLKKSAPTKAGADIWISEIGRNIAQRKDQPVAEREAAAALVKLYVMALAQGIRGVQWFEGQDPAGEEPGFGLLKRDGTPRASYHAFKTMTATLGATPNYLGWVALGEGGRAFGFAFQNQSGAVLVAWKGVGDAEQSVTFAADVQIISSTDIAKRILPVGQPLVLGNEPVFVSGLPPSLVTQAVANRERSFPWGGDFSRVKTVSTQLGVATAAAAPGTPSSAGVFPAGRHSAPKVTFPDGTSGLLLSANQSAQFHVHPTFASVHTREYFVRITVRRVTPGNVGMNLVYEVADSQGRAPYKNVGTWFSLGKDDGWQTHTWQVKDACFAKMWGYDLNFVPEQSQPFVIGKVEVSTEKF